MSEGITKSQEGCGSGCACGAESDSLPVGQINRRKFVSLGAYAAAAAALRGGWKVGFVTTALSLAALLFIFNDSVRLPHLLLFLGAAIASIVLVVDILYYDESGKARATWQHSQDSSAVWAVAIANSTDSAFVDPNAIPWLLLRVVGAEDGPIPNGALSRATYLQRINTQGGLAPEGGCSRALDLGVKALVPYSADYVFFRR